MTGALGKKITNIIKWKQIYWWKFRIFVGNEDALCISIY